MPISMGEMVREFVVLNHCYALGVLTPAKRKRWQALGHIVNLELARYEAREQGLILRREATRAPVRYPVQFLSAAVFGAGETVDLSCGGCAFNARDQLRIGDEIELTVKLPGSLGPLHPTGRIRWTVPSATLHGCQAGVAFAAIDDKEREALMACVLGKVAPFFAAEA
jgi:Tfp pilus assembly protein PilZ